MELANQIQAKNPLEEDFGYNDPSTMNLKLINNEYSIQLDADTIKHLTMKKKPIVTIPNDDEAEMRMNRKSHFFD